MRICALCRQPVVTFAAFGYHHWIHETPQRPHHVPLVRNAPRSAGNYAGRSNGSAVDTPPVAGEVR